MTHEMRKRSIYEAVLYNAQVSGRGRFAFPPDLARTGVQPAQMDLTRAELRFGLSDPRGLGANPQRRGRRPPAAPPAGRRKQRRPRLLRLGRRDQLCRRNRWRSSSPMISAAMPRSRSRRTPATRAGRCIRRGRSPSFAGGFIPG